MSLVTPPVVVQPFGDTAGVSFITLPIPEAAPADPARASFEKGFPEITFMPVVGGGLPPDGRDFNGILYTVTAHCAYIQAGQPYVYNSTVAAANPYGRGSMLGMTDGTGIWFSLQPNNTANPDTTGNNWVPLYSYGFASLTGLTGGIVTLTVSQWKKNTIVLSGTLTSNLQVIFPLDQREWRIVNQCSGSFTVTVKTAAGSGVNIPSGGFASSVSVYGDGANLYPSVAPFVLPLDVAPNSDTIAQRSNLGFLYATYFNSNVALENPTIGSVIVQNSAADGFLRKISPGNFAAQIALSQFAGAVTNSQVPQSAVTQHAAALFASAALTGNPTAPTAAIGDSDTSIATTAFVNPASSLIANGYTKLANGLILQWGYQQGAAGPGTVSVTFPIPFTTAFVGLCTTANRTAAGTNGYNFVSSLGTTGMVCAFDVQTNGQRGGYWVAIGV